MTLAHLHTSRATVPAQSNVIEAGATTSSGDREWFYNLEQGTLLQRKGPVSFQQVLYAYTPLLNNAICSSTAASQYRPCTIIDVSILPI